MTPTPDDQHSLVPHLDKNVSTNWRPVVGLDTRPSRLMFSDRLWYWLLSLAGVGITVVGIAICWSLHRGGLGGMIIGFGVGVFAIGPSQAARKGYRI